MSLLPSFLPNLLSFLRIPLAACLLINDPTIRCAAVVGAMISDILDGFLARRFGLVSKVGTWLDPLTDKLFVMTALIVFFFEKRLTAIEIAMFLGRDLSLIAFSLYLWMIAGWERLHIRAFFCGKVVTTFQFVILIAISANSAIPVAFFALMGIFGALSFVELLKRATCGDVYGGIQRKGAKTPRCKESEEKEDVKEGLIG